MTPFRSAMHRIRLGGAIALGTIIGALLLRSVDLDNNPPGLWQDEASTGLDAYRIWQTGRDRTGARHPVISASFGDYPLAGYRYLDAPIVGLLGMTPAHERAVAMLFGTLLVPLVGFVAYRTLARRRHEDSYPREEVIAIGSLIAAALGPELVQFSRYGSEAILLPFCLVLGWALFEVGRDPRRRIALWGGALALAASAYTYHAVKLYLPIWIAGLLVYLLPLLKELWRSEKKHLIGPLALFTVCTLPSVRAALTPQGMYRGTCVMAWYRYHGSMLVKVITENYLSYFDPRTLFVLGGSSRVQSIVGLGELNLLDAPFLAAGLAAIVDSIRRRTETWRAHAFVLFWFFTGPLPGGLSYEPRNVGRVIAWYPALSWISGIGVVFVMDFVRSLSPPNAVSRLLRALLAAGVAATLAWLCFCLFVRYPKETERDWQGDVTGMMRCAHEHRKNERIVISTRFPYPEVFGAFFFEDVGANGRRAWSIEDRAEVRLGELYVFPAGWPAPKGKPLCTYRWSTNNLPLAYVYGPLETGLYVQPTHVLKPPLLYEE
jgi:hypothetical protein